MQLRLTLTELSKHTGVVGAVLIPGGEGSQGVVVDPLRSIAEGLGVSMNSFLDTHDQDAPSTTAPFRLRRLESPLRPAGFDLQRPRAGTPICSDLRQVGQFRDFQAHWGGVLLW